MIKGSMECVLPVSYLLSQLRCVFVPARVPMLALNVNILTLPHVVTLPLTSHDLWPRRKRESMRGWIVQPDLLFYLDIFPS